MNSRMMRPRPVVGLTVGAILGGVLFAGCDRQSNTTQDSKKLHLLAWVGYDEPEFLEPLKKDLGADIVVKTYVGGDQMYSLFTSAPPGTYDAVIVDAEYGERMYNDHQIVALERDLWYSQDLFSPFASGQPANVRDDVYGAVLRWGALGLVYNTQKLNESEVASYDVLFTDKVKGRVGIFDWYLPNMGVFSRHLGHKRPYDLDASELHKLSDALRKLRPQVRSIQANTGDVIGDLRSGEVWVTPAIGEWAAAVLAEEGKPIHWTVPKEGGIMWVEAIAIPTSGKNQALSKELVRMIRKPEHLARLAWRKAYHSQSSRRDAYGFLSQEQKGVLRAKALEDVQNLIDLLVVRKLPGPRTSEADWIRLWTEFKSW